MGLLSESQDGKAMLDYRVGPMSSSALLGGRHCQRTWEMLACGLRRRRRGHWPHEQQLEAETRNQLAQSCQTVR